MTAALPPEAAGQPVEIWFTDEARVGQQGTLTRVWAKRGSRPRAPRAARRAPRDRRYEWAYLFGAICPERRTGAAIIILASQGTIAVIAPMRRRLAPPRFDAIAYRQRNLIERAFCRLKDWRGIATRYDKTPP